MTMPKHSETDRPSRSVSPYRAGLTCSCPACGEAPLFVNMLEVKAACSGCGFDLSKADPGDGAQVFVILILGGFLALLGFFMVGALAAPILLTLCVLAIATIGGAVWLLRIFKATLVAIQFYHDAHEGRLEDRDT